MYYVDQHLFLLIIICVVPINIDVVLTGILLCIAAKMERSGGDGFMLIDNNVLH